MIFFRAVFILFGEILNGAVLPLSLTVCGIILAFRIKLFRILSPAGFFRDLKSAGTGSGTSPFVSLCTALAGTLGVGNIAGVATAIGSGGAGAVFWMWAGALISTAVKYGEVTLAVKYRRRTKDGYYGGAAYTIRDGLSFMIGPCASKLLGGSFAVLCVVNSLVMGTLIQSNSAAAVTEDGRVRVIICLLLAAGVAAVAVSGTGRIGKVTSALIPPLSLLYIGVSAYVIVSNAFLLPGFQFFRLKGIQIFSRPFIQFLKRLFAGDCSVLRIPDAKEKAADPMYRFLRKMHLSKPAHRSARDCGECRIVGRLVMLQIPAESV